MRRTVGGVESPSVGQLLERYDDCLETGGQVVLVAGERGVGKTTLVAQFRDRLADREPEPLVAAGACEPGTQPPYQPFRQVFEAFPEASRPPGVTGATRTLASAGPDEAASRRRSLFADIHDQVAGVATDRPVVLVVEDLHWADGATRSLFEFLVETIDEFEQPVVLVGTYRPEDVGDSRPGGANEAVAAGHRTVVELEPFDVGTVASVLARQFDTETVPRPFARAVHEHTRGVALFVAQLGALLVSRLGPVEDGTALPETLAGLSLPETVEAAVAERLATLPNAVASLLRLGAVIGESFEMDLLAGASERERSAVEASTDVLVERGIWRRSDGRVSFVHRALREGALDLDGVPREHLHARAAAAIEAVHADDRSAHAGRIAPHHEAAGDHERAIEWYRKAGKHARDAYAHGEAVEAYRRALELAHERDGTEQTVMTVRAELAAVHNAAGDHERALDVAAEGPDVPAAPDASNSDELRAACQLLGERSRAQLEQADYDGARETLEHEQKVVARLDAPALEAQVLGRLGELARRKNEYEAAEDHLVGAIQLARDVEDRQTVATLLRELGTAASDQGEYDRARECHVDSLAICRELDDRLAESYCLNNLGRVAYHQDSNDQARRFYEESLAIKRAVGDRRRLAQTLSNLGVVERKEGKYERACERYERSLAVKREVGDRLGIASTLTAFGAALRSRDEYDRARECFEEARDIARDIGDRRLVAMTLNNLGTLATRHGEYDRARERYEEALEIKRDIGDRRSEASSLNNLADIAYEMGRYDRAREDATASLDIRREIGDRRGEAECLSLLGRVARDCGNHERAWECYEAELTIMRDTEFQQGLIRALLNQAQLARTQGDYEHARQLLEEAGTVLDGLTGETLFRGHLALESAHIALATGEPGRARERATEAREAFEAIENDHLAGRARDALGRAAAAERRADRARECWQEALAAFCAADTPQDALTLLREWVRFERDLGASERADQLLGRARDILADAPAPVAEQHGEWIP